MKLVNSQDFGIRGNNWYFSNRDRWDIALEELEAIGVIDGNAYIDETLLEPLKKANEQFRALGYEIMIDDGYRSAELYQLAFDKRVARTGSEVTKKLLNMDSMPHSTGLAIDVALIDIKTGEKLFMRDNKDGIDGCFVGYYKDKTDALKQEYQKRQDMLIGIMKSNGFKLGSKNEYWHFELDI